MLNLAESNVFWLPYPLIILLIAVDIQISQLLASQPLTALISSEKGLLVVVQLLAAGAIAVALGLLVSRRKSRLQSVFAMVIACLFAGMFLLVIEVAFPAVHRYSRFQISLQQQLDRRLNDNGEVFCGVQTSKQGDYLGWIDTLESAESGHSNVVFIGDSFLETRTTKPLAGRVSETLQSLGHTTTIRNLSKDDTGPETDYRHKFYEFAFDTAPEEIMIFIYSGNDLSTRYQYAPYRHPMFSITQTAIDRLREFGIHSSVIDVVMKSDAFNRSYVSRADFVRATGRYIPNARDIDLFYLTSLAYAQDPGTSFTARAAPNTVCRLLNARENISDRLKAAKKAHREEKQRCAHVDTETLKHQYNAIYEEPIGVRLEKIADFIAENYCRNAAAKEFHTLLQSLDAGFVDAIITCPESLGSLMRSVVTATYGEIERKTVRPDRVDTASDNYVALLCEFHDVAVSRGVDLTVVFIPVATHADATFQAYWEPLRGIGPNDGRGPAMVAAISEKLEGKVPYIDLSQYRENYNRGYWLFDGHWNEKGNAVTAAIIAEHLASKRRASAAPVH